MAQIASFIHEKAAPKQIRLQPEQSNMNQSEFDDYPFYQNISNNIFKDVYEERSNLKPPKKHSKPDALAKLEPRRVPSTD